MAKDRLGKMQDLTVLPRLPIRSSALLYAFIHLKYIVLQRNTFEFIMKTEMLSTRIDHDTKVAFTSVCDAVGLSPSQAIKLFAKAVINYGGIPFEVKATQPNSQTIEAIKELENGKGHKAANIKQLYDELGEGKLDNV